eukprot:XP_015572750.1 uncharacterized protein LOC107260989 [Ricinus communis]
MYFDRAVNTKGAGLGVVMIMTEGEVLPIAKRLVFKVVNNMVEYKVCLFGLEVVMVAGAKHLMVYGDSMLVIQQALEEWKMKEERLKLYINYLKTSLPIKPLVILNSVAPYYQKDRIMQVHMGLEEKPWFYNLKRFIESREYLEEATARERYSLWVHARNYISHEGVLYKGIGCIALMYD